MFHVCLSSHFAVNATFLFNFGIAHKNESVQFSRKISFRNNMKIAFLLSALMGLLSLTQARLQVATTVLEQQAEMATELGRKKKQETGWHKPVHLSFKLEHFKTFEDEGAEAFNKKLAAGAFNRAFEQVFEGMSSDWGFIDSLVQVPEPEDLNQLGQSKPNRKPVPKNKWVIYYGTYSYDARCRLCPEDLLARGKNSGGGESFSNFLRDQAKWDEVAKLFCMELKGTGIENFAEIKNCAFTVGYLGENEAELLLESSAPAALESQALTDASGSMNALVTAYRVHPSAVLDVDVLEKAFAVAYNNVFEDRDYVVEGVQLLRQITAPEFALGQTSVRVHGNEVAISVWDEDEGEDDGEDADDGSEDADDDDDDDDVDFLTAMYWLKVDWTCKGKACSADDMLPGVFLQNTPDVSRHTILESYFCHNLREFGDAAFADVAGCDIMFQVGM